MSDARLELIGEAEQGHMAHINCQGPENSLVGDCDDAGNDVAYCFSCGMEVPTEVCDSFAPLDKTKDLPVWQFDGIEWRTAV